MHEIIDCKILNKKDLLLLSVEQLEKKGVVVLRNLFKKELVMQINKSWETYFRHPSISGTIGYAQTSQKTRK